jgi:hypothetical protein
MVFSPAVGRSWKNPRRSMEINIPRNRENPQKQPKIGWAYRNFPKYVYRKTAAGVKIHPVKQSQEPPWTHTGQAVGTGMDLPFFASTRRLDRIANRKGKSIRRSWRIHPQEMNQTAAVGNAVSARRPQSKRSLFRFRESKKTITRRHQRNGRADFSGRPATQGKSDGLPILRQ